MLDDPYRIPDDPEPTRLHAVAVHPQWPLLAVMVAGAWLAWPWLAFNAFALGSATRWREVRTLALGAVVTVVAAFSVLFALDREWLENPILVRLLLLAIVVWKVAIGYRTVAMQGRSHANYEFNGGRVRNGVFILGLGALARSTVVGAFDSLLWKLVVSGAWWLL